MRITISGRAFFKKAQPPLDLAPVRAAVRRALHPYGLPADTAVTIAFIDDTAMRALNKRHRRKDRTTDVLSFGQALPRGAKGAKAVASLGREPDGTLELGDIVISPAQAGQQARRRRHPLAHEVAFLAAHGALHLLGFRDDTTAGYREMVRLGEGAVPKGAKRRPPRTRSAGR
ncbi:MAG: rRNA maturation RNase YbeY [Chloroflexi bacterium]|nr:rRNA maturation RNase YbeY [Chloroflexota bacterium]